MPCQLSLYHELSIESRIMLTKIGFKELGSEKTLSAEVVDEDRIRFFAFNQALEQRIHVDATNDDAGMLLALLSDHLGTDRPVKQEARQVTDGWDDLCPEHKAEVRELLRQLN